MLKATVPDDQQPLVTAFRKPAQYMKVKDSHSGIFSCVRRERETHTSQVVHFLHFLEAQKSNKIKNKQHNTEKKYPKENNKKTNILGNKGQREERTVFI